MTKQLQLLVVMVHVLISCDPAAEESDFPIMGNLELGNYQVGYQTLFIYDETRPPVPFADWDGRLYPEKEPAPGRQHQINLWYPAEKGTGNKLRFEHYVHLLGRMTNFNDSPAQHEFGEQIFIDRTNGLGGEGTFTKTHLDSLMAMQVISRIGARVANGKFPLVLFPNTTSPAFNSITCEYLASHGFVVAGFVAKGRFSSAHEVSTIGLETAVDDLEFALSKVSQLPYIDTERVALMANAIVSSVCAAAVSRNPRIKALISIEGGFPSAFEQRLLRGSVFYQPENMKTPTLVIYASHPSIDPQYTFHLKYSDRYYARFPQMSEFAMLNFGMFDSFIPDIIGKNKGTQLGYETANRLVLRFLEGRLKDVEQELFGPGFLSETREAVDTVFFKKGLAVPPNIAQMKNYFFTGGFAKVDSVYQAHREQGDRAPFSPSFITNYRIWLSWEKDDDYQYRHRLYNMAYESYPESCRINFYLAYYAKQTGNSDQARTHYRKAQQLMDQPDDPPLLHGEKERIRGWIAEDLKEL